MKRTLMFRSLTRAPTRHAQDVVIRGAGGMADSVTFHISSALILSDFLCRPLWAAGGTVSHYMDLSNDLAPGRPTFSTSWKRLAQTPLATLAPVSAISARAFRYSPITYTGAQQPRLSTVIPLWINRFQAEPPQRHQSRFTCAERGSLKLVNDLACMQAYCPHQNECFWGVVAKHMYKACFAWARKGQRWCCTSAGGKPRAWSCAPRSCAWRMREGSLNRWS